MTSGAIDNPSTAPARKRGRAAVAVAAEPRTDTPPKGFAAVTTDESHAINAAAKVNGWVLIRAVPLPDGGHRYVYANDLSTNLASRPALAVLTTDAGGRVTHARRDVARRTFTDERERDSADTHVFDFADSVFRVQQ
ncbi:hypothetical protein ACQ856_18095 [Mycolicibacterium psychrotolerans]|uniref:hypothetical protein n=1 Tax=Mycolicibacterium psychrotolerans TaxID=216929 RepID=UPI003D672309